MADCDRQCISGIGTGDIGTRQLHADHVHHLALVRVTDTDNGLFNGVWGVFTNLQPDPRRGQHRDTACLTELERSRPVFVDKRRLDRRLGWAVQIDNFGQPFKEREQPV